MALSSSSSSSVSSPSPSNNRRLRGLLDQADGIDGSGSGHGGIDDSAEIAEEGRAAEPTNLQNLRDYQKFVLAKLSKHQLCHVIDILSSGCRLDQALQQTSGTSMEAAKKAAADQYKTLSVADDSKGDEEEDNTIDGTVFHIPLSGSDSSGEYYTNIARFVPLRLTYEERRFLRLLESTLEVSEYTDKIDVLCGGNKARRIAREIKQICAILSGLVLAHSYEDGQRLVKNRDYAENCDFFRSVFEIGRRYKILNPERMRSNYGKLLYVMMDARRPEIQDLLEFDCVMPVCTVYSLLESRRGGLDILRDPMIRVATAEIMPDGKTRSQVQKEIKLKEAAIKMLSRKYCTRSEQKKATGLFGLRFGGFFQRQDSTDGEDENSSAGGREGLTPEEIEQCLYSLGDHNTYLRFNREPCEKMIQFLKQYFDPQDIIDDFSLSISAGDEGSRLTHSHSRQYFYALQSLTLWREVSHEMFALWHCGEEDMLERGNHYRLRDTGQGLNRVQEAPRVLNAMQRILYRVQREVGGWVGSSAIHLGDHNVPNAFMFIDKYTQVPRILGPLVLVLENILDVYASNVSLKNYIDNQFGGAHAARRLILCDFFRHAFDGSGADNFFDAGSCIDGRLTSAWNWCSKIERKSYFPLFLLAGFTGFDGRFQ